MKIPKVIAPSIKKASALVFGLLLSSVAAFSAPPRTDTVAESESSLKRPYAYFANGETVATVLQNVAKNFGLTVKMTGTFRDPISGRIAGNTAADMLIRMSEMYGFNWFIFGKTLYISRGNDRVVQRIRVTPGAADSLKQALSDIGLITPRFGWGAVPEEDAVIVTGPREYVNLVVATVAKLESGDAIQTMVFRLKYASVEDRRIQLRDREVVTRGMASILSGLLGAKNAKPAPIANQSGVSGNITPSQPLAPLPGKLNEGGSTEGPKMQPGDQARANANGPTIESDARLNAIIIRDHISKQRMYADLIAELDVPTPLVEIEASIIEIDQSKLDEMGADWRYGSRSFGVQSFASDQSPGPKAGFQLGFGTGGSASVINDLRGFNATLRMLESSGEAKVLAKPVVLTLDNLGAVLDLTDTSYTSVIGEKVANVVPVTVGTLLRVTPHVIAEDTRTRIQLAVDIEDGAQQEVTETSKNLRVKKTNISTQAIIEPSQSLLIAGYSLEQDSTGKTGIPVLGKLPIIGNLFSTNSTSSKRLKRLFLITPKVLSNEGRAVSSAATALPNAPLNFSLLPPVEVASPSGVPSDKPAPAPEFRILPKLEPPPPKPAATQATPTPAASKGLSAAGARFSTRIVVNR